MHAEEYAVFMLVVFYVTQYGICTQPRMVNNVCHVLDIFFIVMIVISIFSILKCHTLWLLSMLSLVAGVAMVYRSVFARKQHYVPRIQPLVCFVLSLLYCMACVDSSHPVKF